MIDAKRIEEMKRLSAEATKGTWEIDRNTDDNDFVTDIWFDGADEGHAEIHGETIASSINNAQFIAESRQFVPDIIAAYEFQLERLGAHDTVIKGLSEMVERRDAEIEELREALRFYANGDIYEDNSIADNAEFWKMPIAEDCGELAREALAWRNTTRK